MQILFLCTHNSCRSQMAEGLARSMAPAGWTIVSAGTKATFVHPQAMEALAELGIDARAQSSKAVTPGMLAATDVVVTVCGDADEKCPVVPRTTRRHHWPINDPAKASAELAPAAFRSVRDELAARIRMLIFALGEGRAEVRATRLIHDAGFMKFRQEDLLLPNGAECSLAILRHPGAACVLPVRPDGSVVLIRQYRHAAGGFILEAPAGKLDGDETPESCALREIEEEAGLSAGRLHRLGPILTTPGFTDEVIHLFAATQLTSVPARPEHDEIIETLPMPLAAALELARSGEIRDGKTLCALWRTEQELRAGTLQP